MSSEEFWKDDPQLFVSYRTSFVNKKERELEELDYKCWLQGLYNYNGNASLFASFRQFLNNMIAGMFKGNKDNTKIETYPEKPYRELKKNDIKKKQIKKEQNNYQDFERSLAYYGTLKQQYKEKMCKKGE